MFHLYDHQEVKKTPTVVFGQKLKAGNNQAAITLVNQLSESRKQYIASIIVDKKTDLVNAKFDKHQTLLHKYLEMVQGLSADPASPLRFQVNFIWTNVVGKDDKTESLDIQFERGNILLSWALWLMELAEKKMTFVGKWFTDKLKAESREMIEDSAEIDSLKKEAYHALLQAAGTFKYIRDVVAPLIEQAGSPYPNDFKPEILTAFETLCLVQAQEITVHRAVTKKMPPTLVSKLAHDTSDKYKDLFVTTVDWDFPKYSNGRVGKLRVYARYKCVVYEALGYLYRGLHYYSEQGGEKVELSIACGRKVGPLLEQAAREIKVYMKASPKTGKELEPLVMELPAFIEIEIGIHLGKWEKMNNFVTRGTVPNEAPDPESKSMVASPDVEFPPPHETWTPEIYSNLEANMVRY